MAKRTNNDLQNTTQKSKYRATRTSLKTGVNSLLRKGTIPVYLLVPVVLLLFQIWWQVKKEEIKEDGTHTVQTVFTK